MAEEHTYGKWSLWATHLAKVAPIAECYPTRTSADERATVLRLAGYVVEVVLAKLKIGD